MKRSSPTPPENELREQIKTRFFAAVEYGAKNPDAANDALRIRMLDYVDETMEDFAQAKQAWTVEARIDTLKESKQIVLRRTEIPKDARNPTRDQTVVIGEAIAETIQHYIDEAELQPPTAESEAEG